MRREERVKIGFGDFDFIVGLNVFKVVLLLMVGFFGRYG